MYLSIIMPHHYTNATPRSRASVFRSPGCLASHSTYVSYPSFASGIPHISNGSPWLASTPVDAAYRRFSEGLLDRLLLVQCCKGCRSPDKNVLLPSETLAHEACRPRIFKDRPREPHPMPYKIYLIISSLSGPRHLPQHPAPSRRTGRC